jgi:hypothetical protein
MQNETIITLTDKSPIKEPNVQDKKINIITKDNSMSTDDTKIKFNNQDFCHDGIRKRRGFLDIKDMMDTKFAYQEGQLSIILDIITMYLKGQKLLYIESKEYCEFYLYRLMMPAIFISSVCSVISGVFSANQNASITVACLTAFNAFILSIINYLKLDAKAEAHKMTAYSFDQLISICEFTSGKILLSNPKDKIDDTYLTIKKVNNEESKSLLEKNKKLETKSLDEISNTKATKYDLAFIQNLITDIENKVKEMKGKNQFLIPQTIRNRYPTIYNTNIFSSIKKIQIDEMIKINELKIIYNNCVDFENRVTKGEIAWNDKDYIAENLIKQAKINEIIEFRKTILEFDEKFNKELLNTNHNRHCCRY